MKPSFAFIAHTMETLDRVVAAGKVRPAPPVGITRCEAVWELRPYRLEDFLLWCVLDGVGRAALGDREIALAPGACLLLPPGAALGATHDPRRPLRVFHLHADFIGANGRRLDGASLALPAAPVLIGDLATFEPLAREVVAGYAAGTAAGKLRCDLALRLLLLQLHEAGRVHPARSDPKLAAVLLAVKEDPGRPWTVPELAAQAGLSASQVARRIKEQTGRSPQAFVIRARIERARHLMRESPLSLKQIAATLGYTDVYFFHRQFKAVTGQTPGQWRRRETP